MNEKRADELIVVLGELKSLHEELLLVIRRKLEAMRRADGEQMQSCAARERFLAERIRQREGLRRQLAEAVTESLEMGASDRKAAKMVKVGELAERMDEPRRSRMIVLASAIRQAIEQVDQANRVAALVGQEMAKHFQKVREAVISASGDGGVYCRTGRCVRMGGSHVLDAVG